LIEKLITFLLKTIRTDSRGKPSIQVIEGVDNTGRTEAFTGTATTTVQSIPLVAGEVISSFVFAVDGKNVKISADDELSFFNVPDKGMGSKDVKGGIKQLQVKTSSGSTDFDLWVDFKEQP